MINVVVCITCNLFRLYLIYKYIKIFVEEEPIDKDGKRLVRGFAFVAFFLINTGSYLMFHSAWVNLAVNLSGIIFLAFMYHKSLKASLFTGCSIYFIDIVCDSAATLPFVEYRYGQETNQFYFVITVFLFFVCELLAEKIVSYRTGRDVVQSLPLAMMLVPISSIVTFGLLMYIENSSQTVLLIVSMGFLISNFLLLYLYNLFLKSFTQHYENEALNREAQAYANQIAIIRQNEENINLLKHDMKHHLNELKLLAMQQKTSEILKYIKEMEDFMQNPDELISSGNIEIDSILNYMLQKAKKSLRVVHAKVQMPEKVAHSFDINVVLGNLLENAIEAAEKTEEKMLNVVIGSKQGYLRIRIENSFSGAWVSQGPFKKGTFISAKRRAEGHGFGLRSVRKIVEKYNGTLEIYPERDYFCVKIMLYLPEIDSETYSSG